MTPPPIFHWLAFGLLAWLCLFLIAYVGISLVEAVV
jgi:hypothetical protein